MERANTRTVVGLYDDINDARMAVQELVDRGFDRNNISLMTRSRERQAAVTGMEGEQREVAAGEGRTSAGEGAGIGAILGGTAGLLVGLGALAIPGIGPVIAAGTLAAAVLGAGAAGGLVGALVGAGIPRDVAGYYAEGVRRGGTLVAVTAPSDRVDEASSILRSHHPVDVQRRAEEWRRSGWTDLGENVSPYSGTSREQSSTRDVEAKSQGGQSTGRNNPPASSSTPGSDTGGNLAFQTYETVFRQHYQNTYGQTGHPYTDYEAAYHYGFTMAQDPRYQDKTWADVEAQARNGWEQLGKGSWADYRLAIHEGWEQGIDFYEGQGVGRREEAISPEGADQPYRVREPGSEIPGIEGGGAGVSGVVEPGSELPGIEGTGGIGTTGRGRYTGRSSEQEQTMGTTGRMDYSGGGSTGGGNEPMSGERVVGKHPPVSRDTTGGGMGGADWDSGLGEAGGPSRVVEDYEGRDWEMGAGAESNRYEANWRRHYQNTYAQAGGTFEDYEPGYRYGYNLANEPRYQDLQWRDIEPQVRQEWEQRNEGPWERFKEAIREGWDEVRSKA